MLNLTKQEKIILLFLTVSFICGSAFSAFKKSQASPKLRIQTYEIETLEDADRFIEQQAQVNINSFDINELTRLPGIGKTFAQRIIDYHKLNGPFYGKEELMRVKGIGEKKFEILKDSVILE
ncbi:ComEA family DNA-binding protein [Candidatus Omnitrophota bacterium]